MIVSVTFRHDTENKTFRHRVKSECMMLTKIVPMISSIKVVFYYEKHHNNFSDLVTCHISVNAPDKQHVDIYEHQPCEKMAFDRALERIGSKLSRINSVNLHNQKNNMRYQHGRRL